MLSRESLGSFQRSRDPCVITFPHFLCPSTLLPMQSPQPTHDPSLTSPEPCGPLFLANHQLESEGGKKEGGGLAVTQRRGQEPK